MGHLWEWQLPTLDNHPWFLVITEIFLIVGNRAGQINFEAACTSIKKVCLLIKLEWQFQKKCSKFVQIAYYIFVNLTSHITNKTTKNGSWQAVQAQTLSQALSISKKIAILHVMWNLI